MITTERNTDGEKIDGAERTSASGADCGPRHVLEPRVGTHGWEMSAGTTAAPAILFGPRMDPKRGGREGGRT